MKVVKKRNVKVRLLTEAYGIAVYTSFDAPPPRVRTPGGELRPYSVGFCFALCSDLLQRPGEVVYYYIPHNDVIIIE